MIRNYTSKPVHIEAMLYNGETAGVLPEWLRKAVINRFAGANIANVCLITRRGIQTVWAGQDYIIHYEDGSVDVMRKDVFEATFEEDKT